MSKQSQIPAIAILPVLPAAPAPITVPPPLEPGIPAYGRPTDAPAGSAHKIAVMAARAARGEAIFHPRDNTDVGCPPGPQTGGRAHKVLPPGVYRYTARQKVVEGRYRARVWDRGRDVALGVFGSIEAAEAAVLAYWRTH